MVLVNCSFVSWLALVFHDAEFVLAGSPFSSTINGSTRGKMGNGSRFLHTVHEPLLHAPYDSASEWKCHAYILASISLYNQVDGYSINYVTRRVCHIFSCIRESLRFNFQIDKVEPKGCKTAFLEPHCSINFLLFLLMCKLVYNLIHRSIRVKTLKYPNYSHIESTLTI